MKNLIETLESRQHLSAVTYSTASDGIGLVLSVSVGDKKSDDVKISNQSFTVNGVQTVKLEIFAFNQWNFYTHVSTSVADQIDGVAFFTGSGNDHIQITNYDKARTGTDYLMVYAGPGNDSIFCEGGFCMVNGESGNDLIVGHTDTADAYGNFIFDFTGGAGNDTLIGSDFTDALNGDIGNDLIIGNDGSDYISFGYGRDTVYAGGGNDVLMKARDDMSRSIVDGGTGIDTLGTYGDGLTDLTNTFSKLKISNVEVLILNIKG